MIRQTQGSMSEAQAAALGMLSPCAGVAAMAGVLAELAFASSPRAAGQTSAHPYLSLYCVHQLMEANSGLICDMRSMAFAGNHMC